MNTNIARVPAGVTTGGQFAPTSRGEAVDVQLETAAHSGVLAERYANALERISQQRSAGVSPGEVEAAALRCTGAAAAVRLIFPTAVSVDIEEMYEPDSTSMSITAIHDAAGNDLADDGVDFDKAQDGVADLLCDALDCVPHAGDSVNGLRLTGSWKSGHKATIDIDEVLRGALPPSQEGLGVTGTKVIEAFRALYGDTGADELGSARDLLTELHHWARANGHDLQLLVEHAGEVADEELALQAAHATA
ncbi:hypothetical protein CHO01_22100 [Cellulomonas hominis]|uniref:Uncharacterized protein n=1 Tax=Cellulomonas hominis TaxID=156981 RepID=A0A511FES3_9CELL|nr:hypothetical protein [Cellulomonas hominis]MBB5474666.1 hypothetical protein [Cellulomonas hominis]NKY05791.1 hypothetical protein [Cellulomonas hominis]GEL47094.1 hypothetical protein CHO01_22100 [Cellulomonas hominis]